MADDIEEFLRRAAARRQQRQAQQPQRPAFRPPDIEIIEPVVEADIVEATPAEESVAEHVSHYLPSSEFGDRERRLGEEIALADEHLKSHLSQVFEHHIGDLGEVTPAVQLAPEGTVGEDVPQVTQRDISSRANEIVQMFRSPKSMRQAILLSEIMHRPEDRW